MKKIYLLFLIFLINLTFAQTDTISTDTIPIVKCKGLDCTWNEFIATLQRVIRAMLIFGYWIAAIACLVGSFMIMLGGYQKGWLSTGKKLITDAIIYYVILLLSGIIFDLFLDFLRPRLYGE